MRIFAKVSAKLQQTTDVNVAALVYAAILVVLAVTQLFGFEDFLLLIESFWLPGGEPLANFLAGFIVTAEVFALPFLLRMNISNLAKMISMVMGWLVPLIWLGLSLWLIFTVNAVTNIGMLGSIITIAPGWLSAGISIVLGVLTAGVSVSAWQDRRPKK